MILLFTDGNPVLNFGKKNSSGKKAFNDDADEYKTE